MTHYGWISLEASRLESDIFQIPHLHLALKCSLYLDDIYTRCKCKGPSDFIVQITYTDTDHVTRWKWGLLVNKSHEKTETNNALTRIV